jgi:nucleotide-binding universal stress UspA family protein
MPCIAVATDFSPRADRAVDRAKLLQRQLGGQLCIIHATELPSDETPDLASLERKMRAATGLSGTEEHVSFLYPSGAVSTAIAKSCEEHDAQMLLLGPARYNSLGDFFLGTAVDYILRSTTRPVLVVKARANAEYADIVAGTDFSPGSAHAILTAAKMFPEARFHVMHAWCVPFQAFNKDAYVADEIEAESKALMDKFMAELASIDSNLADATSHLVRGDTVEALRRGLELNPASLVVLGSHGTSGFRQATIGSVTSDLLRYLDADTLVINSADAH